MAGVVIVAPHFDDAVLDCWSVLSRSAVRVLTVCSGVPPEGTRRFWDFVCGEPDSVKMMRARRDEDKVAVTLSGHRHEQLYLDYLDAQYRKDKLNIEQLAEDIAAAVPDASLFLVPLAASRLRRHSDHIAIRKAGVLLMDRGHEVHFYPDAPYMNPPRSLGQRAQLRLKARAEKVVGTGVILKVNPLNEEQQAGKEQALRAYKTQYKMTNLFSFGGLSRLIKRDYEVVIEPTKAN